jgi:predicted ArsR family transcriptional regulator
VDSRRDTILSFLKTRGHATLGEIAAHLEISKQGALRHLEALEQAALVAVASGEARGPGRPEHVYKLTSAAGEHFPDGHRELTAELVDFMTQEQLRQFFARRAARLEAEYATRLAGLDFEERVRELARLATEHGHMAEVVEAGEGGLAIRHCNCPIQDVAARTGLPCINEQQMYERLLGADVARTTWMAESADDCTYVIKESEKRVG